MQILHARDACLNSSFNALLRPRGPMTTTPPFQKNRGGETCVTFGKKPPVPMGLYSPSCIAGMSFLDAYAPCLKQTPRQVSLGRHPNIFSSASNIRTIFFFLLNSTFFPTIFGTRLFFLPVFEFWMLAGRLPFMALGAADSYTILPLHQF
jgi:hypothetical protein